MSSIRAKLFLTLVTVGCVVGGLGYQTITSFNTYKKMNQDTRISYQLVKQSNDMLKAPFDRKAFKAMQEIRSTLQPEHRSKALSDIIQSYSSRNTDLMRRRIQFFERNEIEYRKYITRQMSYLEKQIVYHGLITIVVALGAFMILYVYVNGIILKPISGLHRKMVDFLNNRYSYQFSVPAPNEIGNLEATFNSLAQRVISNVEELKSLDKAKSEFLSIASHELRTPLTSIKGSLSLLKSGVTDNMSPQGNKLMGIALNETDRLIRLINELLDLAKIEARKFPLNKEWHPIGEVVNNTFVSLQALASTAKVNLVGENLPAIKVHIDQDRIQQVLTNLISNAIKYSPENGDVTVSVNVNESKHLVISVTDQGKGIAPEDQEIVFQQFRQATGPNNPLVKGTGLGLAIAKALVEEHGGAIGLHSSPGKGCSFYFILPEWNYTAPSEHEDIDNLEAAA